MENVKVKKMEKLDCTHLSVVDGWSNLVVPISIVVIVVTMVVVVVTVSVVSIVIVAVVTGITIVSGVCDWTWVRLHLTDQTYGHADHEDGEEGKYFGGHLRVWELHWCGDGMV